MTTHALDVTIPTPSPRIAEAVAKALAVETKDAPPGTRVRIEAKVSELVLHFEADETRGLRAAAHSYLRWADTAIAVATRAHQSR